MAEEPRRTKLVCTIGPASAALVADLVAAGMDVGRVNFSHGTPAGHEAAVAAVRAASEAAKRPVAVMVDLAGPKIRLGELAGGAVELLAGETFTLDPRFDGPGDVHRAGVSHPGLAADVSGGDRILLADGAAELRVVRAGEAVETEVVRGGTVRSSAGVAIPADRLSGPALTARDLADLPRARALGADFIAQSFVRGPDDVVELRGQLGPERPGIITKIETRSAVERFDGILEVADAVMIARGDLGVEIPFEDVPLVQKRLVRRALDRGVPSIVATQMLESMTASPRPTRAEASDVANAVFDGADAIMLSGETAIGAYPVLAADAAVRIARVCEVRGAALLPPGAGGIQDSRDGALATAAVALAGADPEIRGIACYTRTGRTAALLSSLRPRVPIFAFTADPGVAARLALAHGLIPRLSPGPTRPPDWLEFLTRQLVDRELLPSGVPVVLVASTGEAGTEPDVLALHRL